MMFFFLDGSALAKRYVMEVGSLLVDFLLDNVSASRLIVLNIGFAEVVSILVRRKNAGKLSPALFSQALIELSKEIIHASSLRKVEPTNSLVIASITHIPKHSVNSTVSPSMRVSDLRTAFGPGGMILLWSHPISD